MWTQGYKGMYIHGYCHCHNCRVTTADGRVIKECKSLRSAKITITRNRAKS